MNSLDELKLRWAEFDRKLDESIRLNTQLLTTAKLDKVRTKLGRTALGLGLEAAIWLIIVMSLGGFIAHHFRDFNFAAMAIIVDVYAIVMLSRTMRLLFAVRQIDFSKPVIEIQQTIETLRTMRIRTARWIIIGSCIIWAPVWIVLLKAAFDIQQINSLWLWTNIAFGLAMIPLFFWISKKYADRLHASPFVQQFLFDLAGRGLSDAQGFLAELSRFKEQRFAE